MHVQFQGPRGMILYEHITRVEGQIVEKIVDLLHWVYICLVSYKGLF